MLCPFWTLSILVVASLQKNEAIVSEYSHKLCSWNNLPPTWILLFMSLFHGLFVSNHFILFYSVPSDCFQSWKLPAGLWILNYTCSNFWTSSIHLKNGSTTPFLSFNNYHRNAHVLESSLKRTEEPPRSTMWLRNIDTIQDQAATERDDLKI